MVRLVRPPKPTATSVPITLPEDDPQQIVPSQSAPPDSDLNFDRMTVAELRQHLRDQSFRFPSRARKAELVGLAAEHRRQTSDVKSEDLAGIVTQLPEQSTESLQTTAHPTTLDNEHPELAIARQTPATVLGQDATGMTIAQIRGYLRDCSITVPSRARKAELLQMVQEHQAKASEVEAGDLTILSSQLSDLSLEENQITPNPTTDIASNEPGIEPIVSNEVDNARPLANIPNPTDDISYLQPGFEPASLTVPKLRQILGAHEVIYTKAKNKPDLVQLFKANIAPRALATIQAMGAIERTDEGIIDA